MFRKIVPLALWTLTFAVIVLQLTYLLIVRTGVPHQDDWRVLDAMFRAADAGQMTQWLFTPHNGHFLLPANLAYLFSWKLGALDLSWFRLLNFAICLGAWGLVASVVRRAVNPGLFRAYLYLGTALLIFDLNFWEHFSLAIGFSPMFAAVIGACALYQISSAIELPADRLRRSFLGIVLLACSVLSSGIGYAACFAAGATVIAVFAKARRRSRLPLLPWLAVAIGCAVMLCIALSHPYWRLDSIFLRFVLHFVLVAGSIWACAFDSPSMTLNAAFISGTLILFLAMWASFDFSARTVRERQLLLIFAVSLIAFGLGACAAVSVARPRLPSGEFLSSRYTLEASICVLGLLLYATRSPTFLFSNVWCLIVTGYIFAAVREWQTAPYRPAIYKQIEAVMADIDHLSDEQIRKTLYFGEDTSGVRRVVGRMRREHLNYFRRRF